MSCYWLPCRTDRERILELTTAKVYNSMSVTMALNTHSIPSMIDTAINTTTQDHHILESDDETNDAKEYEIEYDENSNNINNRSPRGRSTIPHYPESTTSSSGSLQQRSSSTELVADMPSMLSDRPSMLSETFQDRPSMLSTEEHNGLPELLEELIDDSNSTSSHQMLPALMMKSPPQKRGKRKKYQKYTPEDRIAIGRYCFEHGPAAARKAFQDRYPEMSESVTRGFRDKYKILIGESAVYEFEQQKQRELQNSYNPPLRGRPRKYKLANGQMSPIHQHQQHPPQPQQQQQLNNNSEMSQAQKLPPEVRSNLLLTEYKNINNVNGHQNHGSRRSPFDYRLDDKIRIGRFYSHHGVTETLNHFYREYHDLNESKIQQFYKQYKRSLSDYVVPNHSQPQVFVLEGDHHVSMATTKPSDSIAQSEHNHHKQPQQQQQQRQRLTPSPKRTSPSHIGNMKLLQQQSEMISVHGDQQYAESHSRHSSSSSKQQVSPSHHHSPPFHRSPSYQSHQAAMNGQSPPLRAHSPPHNQYSPLHEQSSPTPRQTSPIQRENSPLQRQTSPSRPGDYSPQRQQSPQMQHSPLQRQYSPSQRQHSTSRRSPFVTASPPRRRSYSPMRTQSPTRRHPMRRSSSPHQRQPSPPPRGYSPTRRTSSPPSRRSPPRSFHPTNMISSKLSTPPAIIHYPRSNSPTYTKGQYHSVEGRGLKRDYESTLHMNGYGSVEYPYDRKHPYDPKSLFDRTNDFYPRKDGYIRKPTKEISPPGQGRSKRYKYQKYTPEDRYNIGKLCNDIGLGATVKVYREQFPRLNESVVRTFRNKYRELLEKGNGVAPTEAIERKPSRRSVSTLIENEVVSQLRQFKSSKIELSENFVIAVADNIIATKHTKEASTIKGIITKEWANSLLWKHKLLEKPSGNVHGVCCERCKTQLICPKCPQ